MVLMCKRINDKAWKQLIWPTLNKKCIPNGYVKVIKEIYEKEKTSVRKNCREKTVYN